MLQNILAGGFLRGRRTYILGLLIALQAVVAWAIGDTSLAQLIEQLPEILGGLGLVSIRAGLANSVAGVAREAMGKADTKPPKI